MEDPAPLDIIIPTLRSREAVQPLVEEIEQTAACPVRIHATCASASAARNRNIGLEQAVSKTIIMVDDDITGLPPGWAVQMVAVMSDHPNCEMASPRLMTPDGRFGVMTGLPSATRTDCEVLRARELCTACVAIRNSGLRFDEEYIGSGFEDNDFCRQLIVHNPLAEFICIHDLRVVHLNEKKNQGGEFWTANQRYFRHKWSLA